MKNTLILGKSGCGKTTGYMFQEVDKIIERKDNLIIVDSKEEYWHTFGDKLKKTGYKTLVINLNEPERSNGFNILWLPYQLYKEGQKDLSLRMLNTIYKELLFNKDLQEMSFWLNSATNYLVGLTLLLFAKGNEKEINLGSIYVLMMEYESKSFGKIKDYLESLSVTNSIYSYLSGTVLSPVETRGGIMATIKEKLCLYVGSDSILKLLCANDIKLTDLGEPYALFILDNEDYTGITNAIIDEASLTLKDYNLVIDNADNLNKIIRLNTILENSTITKTNLYYISRNKDNVRRTYGDILVDKFNKSIDCNTTSFSLEPIGKYSKLPVLNPGKITYINPNKINLN